MKDFQIVTVDTGRPHQPYFTYDEFYKSASCGGKHLILRLGPDFHKYTGLGSKPKMVARAIREGLITAKHIIFSDCFDVVFSCDPQELFTAFKDFFKCPFVISSERNCFPADLKEQYDALPYTSSYIYLNSGMIVAETEAMMAVLEAMDLANVPEDYHDGSRMVHINDQELYQQIFLKQPVPMELDYKQILCNTLHSMSVSDLEFREDGLIRNVETGTYPHSFHFNGSAKTDGLREPILKHLNLM